LTSAGVEPATEVVAEQVVGEQVTRLGTFPVADGTAAVSLTAPASMPEGALVRLRVEPSGTTVTLPTVQASTPVKTQAKMRAAIRPARPIVRTTKPRMAVKVRAGGKRITGGKVRVWSGKRLLGARRLVNGKGPIPLKKFLRGPKRRVLRVVYTGTPKVRGTTVRVVVRVRPRR